MKIMKAYKFRIYPNKEQIILISKTIGCTRFIYNYMLYKKLKNNKLSRFDLNNLIPSVCEEYPYLKEVDSMSLRSVEKDLKKVCLDENIDILIDENISNCKNVITGEIFAIMITNSDVVEKDDINCFENWIAIYNYLHEFKGD